MESIRTIKATAVKYINDFNRKPSFEEIATWVRNYYGQWNFHPNIYIASVLIYIFMHPFTMRGRLRFSIAKCKAVDYLWSIKETTV